MIDRYNKLTQGDSNQQDVVIPCCRKLIFNSWVIIHSILVNVVTNNEEQFTSRLFVIISIIFRALHSAKTVYNPQTNRNIEQYNCTVVTQCQHHVAENQESWHTYVHPLKNAYNALVDEFGKTKLFSTVLTWHLPEQTKVLEKNSLASDRYGAQFCCS